MNTLIDVTRVLVLVLGSGNVAVALVVVAVYARLYSHYHRHTVARVKWRGLLPRHVALIGVAYIVMVMAAMYEVMMLVREDFTWRIPTYFVAFAVGLWAIWDVLGHSRYRLHNIDKVPHV